MTETNTGVCAIRFRTRCNLLLFIHRNRSWWWLFLDAIWLLTHWQMTEKIKITVVTGYSCCSSHKSL